MTSENEESKMLAVLNTVYDKVLDGLPGTPTVDDMANDHLRDNNYKKLEAAKSVVRWQNAKCGAIGFAAGLPGLIALPATLPADLTSSWYVQLRMIAAIARIGGYDLRNDKVRTMCFCSLIGESVAGVLNKVGVNIAVKAGEKALEQIPRKIIGEINKKVGFKLLTKFGQKGVVNLVKVIPVLGGIVGGGLNAVETNAIGNMAIRNFIDPNY